MEVEIPFNTCATVGPEVWQSRSKIYEGDSLVCDDNNVFLQTGIVSAASTEKEYVVVTKAASTVLF